MNNFLNGLDRLDAWSNGVLDEIEAGRLDAAESLCRKLLEHYPDQIDGYHRLAAVREAQGRWFDAVKAYDDVLGQIALRPGGFDQEVVGWLKEQRDAAHKRAGRSA